MNIVIPYKPIDLKNHKIVSNNSCELTIKDGFFKLTMDFFFESFIDPDNESLGTEILRRYLDYRTKVSNIESVEINFEPKQKNFYILIQLKSCADISLYYKNRIDAQQVLEVLSELIE